MTLPARTVAPLFECSTRSLACNHFFIWLLSISSESLIREPACIFLAWFAHVRGVNRAADERHSSLVQLIPARIIAPHFDSMKISFTALATLTLANAADEKVNIVAVAQVDVQMIEAPRGDSVHSRTM